MKYAMSLVSSMRVMRLCTTSVGVNRPELYSLLSAAAVQKVLFRPGDSCNVISPASMYYTWRRMNLDLHCLEITFDAAA